MNNQDVVTLQNILLLFNVAISFAIAFSLLLKQWAKPGSIPLTMASIAIAIWSITQLVQRNSPVLINAPELISVLIFTCLIVAVSMQLVAGMLIGHPRHWYRRLLLLIMVFFISYLLLAFAGSGIVSYAQFVITILPVLSVSNIALAFCITKHALFIPKIDRESVVEAMLDGWMVLDENSKIVDLNKTAEEILGSKKEDAIGKPIEAYQIDIPSSSNFTHSPRDMEMKRSFRTREEIKYFNIRLSPIQNENRKLFTLITWRDITNRRKVEDLRQKARDEMFVLLNAISSEASQSFLMEEFLSGVIYQIIFPFRSQAAIIYLGDNNDAGTANQVYHPASVFGLSEDGIEPISLSSESYNLLNQVFMEGEPYFVENPIGDTRLPSALQTDTFKSILILPLIIRNGSDAQNMGILILARKDLPPYSHDEIARLGTLADHIANLVDNERRRKLAIAFSERQRLMRDLHDSVSQKLYGLVTLTEAAQAAMEAGQNADPGDVLIRIGDNARQAVKEMRLFLYQMQPVEIEKEGLISVLHHRLSAVEGRADIKAGLIADETIKLPPEKEIALFYIAQEALNNILRHARAKKISVTLKQARKNLILKIEDDGIGFDVKNVDRTGLGLANMKDRSEKIDGKLKIESTPGVGTTVVVTLPKPVIK
ncbi:MAG: ATP-binding protein [Anaerolineales bacterium]|nr:MAG: ATP-binding protein [Anaerolineales bacterium]